MLKETAHAFGRNQALFGIVTTDTLDTSDNAKNANDANSAKSARLPGIILLNSGLLPRTGPFRLSVTLSRHLANLGFPVLRFDLSGIGDSDRHQDGRSTADRHVGDVQDAIDMLQRQAGCVEFVVLGICTGADVGFRTICTDDRVTGAILVDGYIYKTPKYYFHYYAPRLTNPRRWLVRLKRVFGAYEEDAPPDTRTSGYYFDCPPKQQLVSDLQSIIDRGVTLYLLFTESKEYLYAEQFKESLPEIRFGDRTTIDWLENTTHIFHFEGARKDFVERVSRWLSANYQSPTVSAE